MDCDAHRKRAGIFGPAGLGGRELKRPGRRVTLRRCAWTAAILIATAAPVAAQETVTIGGAGRGGVTTTIGGGGSGVVINDEVLDSLGTIGRAAGLPVVRPGASRGSPSGVSIVAPSAPGTVYRLPGTGQLVVSRPSTLLFPPLNFPKSQLTVAPPARSLAARPSPAARGGQAAVPEIASAGAKLKSRLLTPPAGRAVAPPQAATAPRATVEPTAPVAPVVKETRAVVTPAPKPEPQAAPSPAPKPEPAPLPAPEPEPQTSELPDPAPQPEEPAAAPRAPAPSPLIQELQAENPAPPAPEAPAKVADQPEPTPPAPANEPAPSKPAASGTQTAALPPAGAALNEMSVLFEADSAELSDLARSQLDTIAGFLAQDPSARVQLLAYAKSPDDSSSRARRLSLSRALAVRAFLIDKGIRSTRMDVRALGNNVPDGPADRVDILPQLSKP